MDELASSLRRQLAGEPVDCSCPADPGEILRRALAGDASLCVVHDSAAIELRRVEALRDIARERAYLLSQLADDQDDADAPVCTCSPNVIALVRDGLDGRPTPTCPVHSATSTPGLDIGIGDDASLVGLLAGHGFVPDDAA